MRSWPEAPSIVDGVSPFTTPGTRLVWGNGDEWLMALDKILERRISTAYYRALEAHITELARHPDFIAAQTLEDLEAMGAAVVKHFRPPKGLRGGTAYERVVIEINNAIQRERAYLKGATL